MEVFLPFLKIAFPREILLYPQEVFSRFYEGKCLDIKEGSGNIELCMRDFRKDIVKECRKFYITIINDLPGDQGYSFFLHL